MWVSGGQDNAEHLPSESESNAHFIIGACLDIMKSVYPDAAAYRAARAAFFSDIEDADAEGLCHAVIAHSFGKITFSDDVVHPETMALITADYAFVSPPPDSEYPDAKNKGGK